MIKARSKHVKCFPNSGYQLQTWSKDYLPQLIATSQKKPEVVFLSPGCIGLLPLLMVYLRDWHFFHLIYCTVSRDFPSWILFLVSPEYFSLNNACLCCLLFLAMIICSLQIKLKHEREDYGRGRINEKIVNTKIGVWDDKIEKNMSERKRLRNGERERKKERRKD